MGQEGTPPAGIRLRYPGAAGVGAPVEHGIAHALQRCPVGLVQSPNDSRDATHQSRSLDDEKVGRTITAAGFESALVGKRAAPAQAPTRDFAPEDAIISQFPAPA